MSHSPKVKKEYGLKPFGKKGWWSNAKINCPFCYKNGKLGILFTDDSGIIHCFRCGQSDSLYNFLKLDNNLHLINKSNLIKFDDKIKKIGNLEKNYIRILNKSITLPFNFKYFNNHEYLNNRGFNPYHYALFTPGYTKSIATRNLEDYIIFVLYQKKEIIGWVARSQKSKEWHEQNIKDYKEGKADLKLRYRNASVNFDGIIGGYNELSTNTKRVYIVEGLFDKVNVDNLMGLNTDPHAKCIFTFGNKISEGQIQFIKSFQIKEAILLYDNDTIIESRVSGLRLSKYCRTEICTLKRKGADPGNISEKELMNTLSNKKMVHDYFVSMIGKKIL